MNGFTSGFMNGYLCGRGAEQLRQEDAALLRSMPMPRNDPRLFEPVRVRVVQPFYRGGARLASVGDVIELPRFEATEAVALKRAQFVE